MKVALVHYWLVRERGGEKVLKELAALYPDADVYTNVYRRDTAPAWLRERRVFTTLVGRIPGAARIYQWLLPLMPIALEQLDLSEYDLVISSESGPAKFILTAPDTRHVCYCHTPMRYIWDQYAGYVRSVSVVKRIAFALVAHYMRMVDYLSASRVDKFIANSDFVAKRIGKVYQRNAIVVYPPVDGPSEREMPSAVERKDFYLWVGELVQYKRPDLAIRATDKIGRNLLVAGGGEMEKELRKLGSRNTTFVGRVSNDELYRLYRECRAVLFTGCEDFGIVPVEAMYRGTPVIAYGKGGALETVVDGVTGVLFDKPSVASVSAAIERFERVVDRFDPLEIHRHASGFAGERFRRQIREVVESGP